MTTAEELYNELNDACQGSTLTLDAGIADGAYRGLLSSLADSDRMEIRECSVSLAAEEVIVSGGCTILPYTSIGAGSLEIRSRVKDGAVFYDASFKVAGEGSFSAFFNGLLPEDHVFRDFIISYPKFTISQNEDQGDYLASISGGASMRIEGGWGIYRAFLSDNMTIRGSMITSFRRFVNIDFLTGRSYQLPFGAARVTLAMRTLDEAFSQDPAVKAFLIMNAHIDSVDEDINFQLPLFTGSDELHMTAFFSPALSVGKITEFMGAMFGVGAQNALLLPQGISLFSFGLTHLEFTLMKKGADFSDGLEVKQVCTNFSLEKPWNMPVPGLTLEDFRIVWEFSWWGGRKEALVTLDVYARALLALGQYKLTGSIKGIFPLMYFEGGLRLAEEDQELSFGDLAQTLNAPLPDSWGGGEHVLAEFLIQTSVPDRSLSFSAQVNDILTVPIGTWTLSIDSIMVQASFAPSADTFAFDGVISFGTETDRFAFALDAAYDKGWAFSGKLAYGTVNIGMLLREMFGIQGTLEGSGIVLNDFSIFYDTVSGQFRLFASFYDELWFEIFGARPVIGGRIRLQKDSGDGLIASVAVSLEVGIFQILVQADDFYRDTRRLLFRVGLWDAYLQCVYSRNEDKEELLSISLGGMTLGDIVNAMIHLLNPNAKTHLDAPWDVLNEIHLSAFSILINVTRKSAQFLYHVGLSIPGLMEISDVGIQYEKGKINYILKGQFLDKKEVTWDAVDGAPPPATASGQKTKVSYLGIGAHLDVAIEGEDLETILKNMRRAIHPSDKASDVKYSGTNKWVIGADVTLGDLFRLQLLLYDPGLYGGKITVDVSDKSPLAQLNGLEVELMYQKVSDSVAMLRCSFVPPKKFARFSLGAITVSLGNISVEIYTNGSFLIDLGFPHNHDFSHSFGIEFGIYTGSGGIYFGALKGDAVKNVPQTPNGTFSPVTMIGIGLKIGLGRSFDLGIVKGGVSLTVSGIFEGVFAVFHPEDARKDDAFYYRVNAMAQIAGTLFLSVDLCIIAVSASASVSAACELTIESYRSSEVALDLALHLGASIKILFIKISFSFDFHQHVSFTFGEDSVAPWDARAVGYRDMAFLRGDAPLFPVQKIGDWKIKVWVSPLLTQKGADENPPSYCITFLSLVDDESFSTLADMLLNWLLAAADGDGAVPYDFVLSLDSDAADRVTLETLESFFGENLVITVEPKAEGGEDAADGVIFPMPHRLALDWNGISADYSQNPVTEGYMNEISEYFKHLNADPFHEIPDAAVKNSSMPFCGAILLDYFRVILSELIARLKRLFGGFELETADLKAESEKYGADVERLLADNPGLVFDVKALPEHLYTIECGDTLSGIARQYGMPFEVLWDCVRELPMIVDPEAQVTVEDYEFNNKTVKLTAIEAAALFYVRICNPDIIYLPYVDRLMEDNQLSYEWECQTPYERDIKIGDRIRKSLAGDTIVRIAKAEALAGGADSAGWKVFLDEFLRNNDARPEEVKDSYVISGTSGTDCDNTSGALARRLFPDRGEIDGTSPVRDMIFLCPLKQIRLNNIICDKTVRAADADAAELAKAVENGGASLEGTQTVKITAPSSMPKDEVIQNVIGDRRAAEIGSMLSRFFLQGLCPPSPVDGEPTPLYILLNQQFDLEDTGKDVTITLSNSGAEVPWLRISDSSVIFTKESINGELPAGAIVKPPVPAVCAPFTETGKNWSIGDKRAVKLKDGTRTLLSLPADLRRYLGQCKEAPTLYCDGSAIGDVAWSCCVEVRLVREERNLFSLIGASANDRQMLHGLLGGPIRRVRLLYRPSPLLGSGLELAEPEFERCVMVRSNLSLQTHMGRMALYNTANSYQHSADIADADRFVRMLWECSTVGGGFLLYMDQDCLPDHLFDEEGVGTVSALITLEGFNEGRNAVNSAIIDQNARLAAFYGDEESVWMANAPVGCVNLQTELAPDGTRLSELFQVMGYSAKIGGRTVESAPILPQTSKEDPDKRIYPVTVPLYRLAGGGVSPYSAVGQTIPLVFFLRDVLGASAGVGTVGVTGEYNDFLVRVGELPYTSAVYWIEGDESGPVLKIVLRFCPDESSDRDAAGSCARTAMYQAACGDIELGAVTTLDNTVRVFSQNQLDDYRAYVGSLCGWIAGGSEPSDFAVDFPIDLSHVPKNIFELSASFMITRAACSCEYTDVKSVSSLLLPDGESEFSAAFAKAFADLKLARDSEHRLYAVPMGAYIQKVQISPYLCRGIATPKMYAVKPYSTSLITRECNVSLYDGTEARVTYVDCDLQVWVKRFFEDIQMLTSSQAACRAAIVCPGLLDDMVEAKKAIAEKAAERLIPLSADFGTERNDAVVEEARDCFRTSLGSVFDIDVFLAYKLDFEASERCRMETLLSGTDLRAKKLASDSDVFCLYSVCDAKSLTQLKDMSVSLLHLEHNISADESGYESSDWLRFETPLESGGVFDADLRAEAGIAHPRNLYPSTPGFGGQSYKANDAQPLKWDYDVTITCKAYEQYTVYLLLVFENVQVRNLYGMRRDIFDILADYDCKRADMMDRLNGSDEEFEKAYHAATQLVGEFARSGGKMGVAGIDRVSYGENRCVTLKINFTLGEKKAFQIAPADEKSEKTLNFFEAELGQVELVSGGTVGEDITFQVKLLSLPIYRCNQVKPYTWIVQNENLFRDNAFPINAAFIFRTTEVSLNAMDVTIRRKTPFRLEEATDVMLAVQRLWEFMGLSDREGNTVSISVAYLYAVPNKGARLQVCMPVTFVPEALSAESVAGNIAAWIKQKNVIRNAPELLFEVSIYSGGRCLVDIKTSIALADI